MIAGLLASVPGLSVVGSAANGRIGMQMISAVKPDVVVLDLEMPEMDGFQVLASLRATDPKLPVVIFSGSSRRRAMATLETLSLGTIDYVAKPSGLLGTGSTLQSTVKEMSQRIKVLGATATRGDARHPDRSGPAARSLRVVVIGISTGGPDALEALLAAIPGDFSAPLLIVQHMPAQFIGPLARRLDLRSPLSVREAVDGQVVEPGQAVIAPGEHHLIIRRQGDDVLVETQQGPPENSCCPAADVLFRSAAKQFGAGTLGVVMTGMGKDGLLGAEEIRRSGGRVLAQDQASSVVWSMPGHVARAGLADQILPPIQLADEIARRGWRQTFPQ